MIQHEIVVNGKSLFVNFEDLIEEIDIQSEITIDYTNLAGEEFTTPLISNAVGFLKADLELEVNSKELEVKVFEANFIRGLRLQASKNGGICTMKKGSEEFDFKITEKALEKSFCGEIGWQKLKNELFIKENYLSKVEVIYWKVQDKLEKLKNHLSGLTPNEFSEEIISKFYERNGVSDKVEVKGGLK